VGLIYVVVALAIGQFGSGWINRLLPPVVIGPVVMVIGLGLAQVAVAMATTGSGVAANVFDPKLFRADYFAVALASLAIEEGHPEAAEPLLGPALEVFAAQKAADWEASAQAVLARSLLGGKRPDDARKALERALALSAKSSSPHVRLTVAAAAGRVMATNGKVEEALLRLDAALAEAVRLHLAGLQLELRLARGEIRIGSGQTAATQDLLMLAEDARARGFGLVARKAEAILRTSSGKSRGAS